MMRYITGRYILRYIPRYILAVVAITTVIVLNAISHNTQPPTREILYYIGMGVGVLFSIGSVTFENLRFVKTRRHGEWLVDLFAAILILGMVLFFYSDSRTIFSAQRIVAFVLLEFVVTGFIYQVVQEKHATSNS